jgi:hypothetical protein
MSDTTWQEIIKEVMKTTGDTPEDIVHSVPEWTKLNEVFDNGFGPINGCRFTIWTTNYVYFPTRYSGAEYAAYVPRNPCDIATGHVGGG